MIIVFNHFQIDYPKVYHKKFNHKKLIIIFDIFVKTFNIAQCSRTRKLSNHEIDELSMESPFEILGNGLSD